MKLPQYCQYYRDCGHDAVFGSVEEAAGTVCPVCEGVVDVGAGTLDLDTAMHLKALYQERRNDCDCNPLGRAHEPPCPFAAAADAVNHPAHYGGADDPYEAIKVIEAWGLGFCLGNAVKYLARAGKKGDRLEDLRKAAWYLEREIRRATT